MAPSLTGSFCIRIRMGYRRLHRRWQPGKTLHVSGVKNASVDVFDMQGRAIIQNSSVAGSMSLEGLNPGSYVFRIASGSMSKILRLQVK